MKQAEYSASSFLNTLLEKYPHTPSFALVRVPEVEYLSQVGISGDVLDHCCGDGFLAHMIWKQGLTAGVDFSEPALKVSKILKNTNGTSYYQSLKQADVSKELPFEDVSFDWVINNSGLEHVKGLDSTLKEIHRVLKPKGHFVFTLASKKAFEWWPEGIPESDKQLYIEKQPYHNILDFTEWEETLKAAGLKIVDYESHFSPEENREIMFYDYYHSMKAMAGRSLPFKLAFLRMFRFYGKNYFRNLVYQKKYATYPNENEGSFFCICAQKENR